MNKVIVTGSAGFIGFHVCSRLLQDGWEVCGIDALTDYYDVNLKKDRNNILQTFDKFSFELLQLENFDEVINVFYKFKPTFVLHLAAQAGVRYSIENPLSYVNSNLVGTFNVLEAIRKIGCKHFLMASTSSVYGANLQMPYREIDKCDTQLSFYASSKKANESMSHSYAHLFGIPTTCFRFFTVYGPWGRPDMALFNFTKKILNDEEIDVYNHGQMVRDFTYVDDLVDAILALFPIIPSLDTNFSKSRKDSLSDVAPWRVVNIGSSNPVKLEKFLKILEQKIGKKIKKNYKEIQAGDVEKTFADISLLKELTGFEPKISLETGIENFLVWYKDQYNNV